MWTPAEPVTPGRAQEAAGLVMKSRREMQGAAAPGDAAQAVDGLIIAAGTRQVSG